MVSIEGLSRQICILSQSLKHGPIISHQWLAAVSFPITSMIFWHIQFILNQPSHLLDPLRDPSDFESLWVFMMPMERMSKQLAVSGQLKAEVRLGLAISEFVEVLDSKRRREFRSMQTSQDAKISGRDIIKMTEEINQEGARRHRSWRPHGTKVGGFLSRIQTFATIGDVLVGGSQNLIATGIWSAVRLSLTVGISSGPLHPNCFEPKCPRS